MCMWKFTSNTQPGCFQLHLSLYILGRASKLARIEAFGDCPVFPDNAYQSKHVHNPVHIHDLLNSLKNVETFKAPHGHLIFQLFLLSFLVSVWFSSTIIHCPCQLNNVQQFNNCLWLFCDKYLKRLGKHSSNKHDL